MNNEQLKKNVTEEKEKVTSDQTTEIYKKSRKNNSNKEVE